MTSSLMDPTSRQVSLKNVQKKSNAPSRCTIKSIFSPDELHLLPANLKTAIERSEHNYIAKQHLAKLMKNGRSTFLNNRQEFSRYITILLN